MQDSILIIEDETDVRESINEILSNAGYNVQQAANGEEAINLSQLVSPDLVISDIMMPGLSGYDVLNYFKKEQHLENIPFVFLTAKSRNADFRYGMNSGADDYITKPFRAKELLKTVQVRLEKKTRWENNLDNIRESFSLAVPHELRTPLIPLFGYADIILDEYQSLTKQEIYDFVKKMKFSVKRLHERIEKFVLLSYVNGELHNSEYLMELKNNTTEISKSNLTSIIQKTAQEFERSEDVIIEELTGIYTIGIAQYYLNIILRELTENACKYSENGKLIKVKIKESNSAITIIFESYGKGFTQNEINRINLFEKFSHGDSKTSGSGMGLFMIKQILKVFGGKLKIKSAPEICTNVSIEIPIVNIEDSQNH